MGWREFQAYIDELNRRRLEERAARERAEYEADLAQHKREFFKHGRSN